MQDKRRPQTVGFTLSAAVPVETVGFVLKAMFDAGCPPASLDLNAIMGAPTNGTGIAHAAPPTMIAAPRRATPCRYGVTPGEVREAVLALLLAAAPSPTKRKDLHVAMQTRFAEPIDTARTDKAVMDLKRVGDVIGAAGEYTLTKRGHAKATKAMAEAAAAPAPPPAEPTVEQPLPPGLRPETLEAFAWQLMARDRLRQWSIVDMAASMAAAHRAGKAKGVLERLLKRGLVKRVATGRYVVA
jgi:hypothetical protein